MVPVTYGQIYSEPKGTVEIEVGKNEAALRIYDVLLLNLKRQSFSQK